MIATNAQKFLSILLSVILFTGSSQFLYGQQSADATPGAAAPAPLGAADLQALVAPIALYPDSLVAQILVAATFPDQVEYINNWLQQNKNLTGSALMQAVDKQDLDPGVKALTQFPSVLDTMAKNLGWTSAMGEAYHLQSTDVMTAIQTLRAKAQAAGNLKSGAEMKVVQESPQTIVIQSANPQVVYVPVYNPTVVYGYAYVTPYYYAPPPPAATVALAFGVGIAVGAMMNSGCCYWGYSSWNTGWHSTTVVYRGGAYYGNPAWNGGSVSHYAGYNSATGTVARGTTVSNGYGSVSAGQAYNPRTGASAATVQGSNAYGSYGASTVSKNGNTAYSQHQTTANGTTGSVKTTNGGQAYGASGANNNVAVGQTANGNKYATANGNTYSNTGNGWSGNSNNTPKNGPGNSTQSAAAKGWGGQEKSGGSSAFGGGGSSGWASRSESARGSSSRSGGGGGGGGGGGRRR